MLDPDPDSQHRFYPNVKSSSGMFLQEKSIGYFNPVKYDIESFTHKESGSIHGKWRRKLDGNFARIS
jgi:hypothetical protein